MTRPKAYALLGDEADLSLVRGDVLNERKFLRMLSATHDIYYNNQLVHWDRADLGLTRSQVSPPDQAYDLHYIRNNRAIARGVEHNLIVMSYPYHPEVWDRATAVLTTTRAWKAYLEQLGTGSRPPALKQWYPRKIRHLPPVLVAEQHIPTQFVATDRRSNPGPKESRKPGTARGAYFGRLQKNSFPGDVLSAIATLRKSGANLTFSHYGPKNGVRLPRWVNAFPPVPHEQIPQIKSGFDFVVYDQDETGHWLGSSKVLEAIGLGVPMLARKQLARVENLGANYPFFYSSRQEAHSQIKRLLEEPGFKYEIMSAMAERAGLYSFTAVRERFYSQRVWQELFSGQE